MPQRSTSATRYYKKKHANCKRTSWAANNILSTSRKILQKTVVKLDPFVESLKKNNSDLARKIAELQKELTDKADEILQLKKESFQIRGELLRLQNFKDSVVSSGVLEKLMLISGDTYRLHEVISDAFRRTDVSSSPDFSVEGSPKEGPVPSPAGITSNARKPSQNRLSIQNYRPTARSVEMEIDSSISSPNSSNLSAARRTVLVDSDDVEDTVMSTPRKTSKLSSGRVTAPVSQVDEYDTAMTSPSKSSELSADTHNEDQDVDVEGTPPTLPLRKFSKFSSGGQAVYASPANENDFYVATSCLRNLSQSDDDDSSSSGRDPDYAPVLKPKRKKAVATRKTSKTSGTPFNYATHPLKVAFTSNDEDKDSDINLEISKPTPKNAAQSTKTSSTSETTLTASPIPSKLKRKKMEYNEPDAVVEEKKSTFENHFVEREQDKEVQEVRVENESASETVEKMEAKEDEVKNDTVERMTSTKRKSRKRKRRLRLVAEDSVFIPISDMTMEVTRGNNKENEIDGTTAAHNADEDATSPKSKLENQRDEEREKENDVKENSEGKPKAKLSAVRSKREQAQVPEDKKSRTELKKVDSEKPIFRTKAISIGAVNKDSEVKTKRSTSLMNKRTSPPSSPHRPRRQASNSISYVVKLNTKLRQGDKYWCKDK